MYENCPQKGGVVRPPPTPPYLRPCYFTHSLPLHPHNLPSHFTHILPLHPHTLHTHFTNQTHILYPPTSPTYFTNTLHPHILNAPTYFTHLFIHRVKCNSTGKNGKPFFSVVTTTFLVTLHKPKRIVYYKLYTSKSSQLGC